MQNPAKPNKNRVLIVHWVGVALIIFVAGFFVFQLVTPESVALPIASEADVPRLTAEETIKAVESGEAILLDTRKAFAYQQQHAKGAFNVPADSVGELLHTLKPNQWYITYSTCPNEENSARAAFEMMKAGFVRVDTVKGGLRALFDAGYPPDH
ncbi:MAG: rhodanese-like domain-containing protein [Anaerolineaceae bacterium]|jgi:rhodanese-related sulfurtransferase